MNRASLRAMQSAAVNQPRIAHRLAMGAVGCAFLLLQVFLVVHDSDFAAHPDSQPCHLCHSGVRTDAPPPAPLVLVRRQPTYFAPVAVPQVQPVARPSLSLPLSRGPPTV